MIRYLCQNSINSFNYMRIVNTDGKSHLSKTPKNCLPEADRAEKNIYLEACLEKRQNFSPFVTSVDRLLDVEAGATLKMLASHIAKK